MKFSIPALTTLLYITSFVTAAPPSSAPLTGISVRDTSSPLDSLHSLEKRKGGGGGRGGSGGGCSGSSGGRTGSGGSYSYQSTSNVGGRTVSGSGTPKTYGNRYTGGAVVPYTAGARSPSRNIAPFALPFAAVAFFPGIWLYSVWAYPYPMAYHWNQNGQNHTTNVTCLCQDYQVCGCDPTDNSTFLSEVVSNGTGGAPVNTTLVRTVDYGNGTVATYINGSLENGTTADGGTDPSNDSQVSAAMKTIMEVSGYWVMIATVVVGSWLAA